MRHSDQSSHTLLTFTDFFFGIPALIAICLYLVAVYTTNRRGHFRSWPLYRTVLWIFGVLLASITVVGPLAHRSHTDFAVHMIGHLLLGMLAPLLMALAAPFTLLLRSLKVKSARSLYRFMRRKPISFLIHPVIASILNIGGLWLLYTTDLYAAMHESLLLYVIIHMHVFLAGYLFTISLIYIDPIPHRFSFPYRTVVFIFALAGHGILSKFIYINPLDGVPLEEARTGAMLMYYGGDLIDLVIIIILFYHWYKSKRPRAFSDTKNPLVLIR